MVLEVERHENAPDLTMNPETEGYDRLITCMLMGCILRHAAVSFQWSATFVFSLSEAVASLLECCALTADESALGCSAGHRLFASKDAKYK